MHEDTVPAYLDVPSRTTKRTWTIKDFDIASRDGLLRGKIGCAIQAYDEAFGRELQVRAAFILDLSAAGPGQELHEPAGTASRTSTSIPDRHTFRPHLPREVLLSSARAATG